MSPESFVFCMGLLVLITPALGLPNRWKEWIFIGLGAVIVIVGYRLRRARYLRSLETHEGERRADAFVENHVPMQGVASEDT